MTGEFKQNSEYSSFFPQDHFQVIWKKDAKYILCEKLGIIPDLEPVSIKDS